MGNACRPMEGGGVEYCTAGGGGMRGEVRSIYAISPSMTSSWNNTNAQIEEHR
jgi:hypothetical protein